MVATWAHEIWLIPLNCNGWEVCLVCMEGSIIGFPGEDLNENPHANKDSHKESSRHKAVYWREKLALQVGEQAVPGCGTDLCVVWIGYCLVFAGWKELYTVEWFLRLLLVIWGTPPMESFWPYKICTESSWLPFSMGAGYGGSGGGEGGGRLKP